MAEPIPSMLPMTPGTVENDVGPTEGPVSNGVYTPCDWSAYRNIEMIAN